MSRYDEVVKNFEWNEGAWNDGAEARIVAKDPITACPSEDTIGSWCAESWKAGWLDADQDLKEQQEALQNWSVGEEWDADNNCYRTIVGSRGEHIATVDSKAVADYIVRAVSYFAQTEYSTPPVW